MQDRSVKQLPNQIRRWADTIETVNSSPSLSPEQLPDWAEAIKNPDNFSPPLNRTLNSKWAVITARRFSEIPGVLRLYADHLHAILELFHGSGRRKLGLGYGTRLQTWYTLELLNLVRISTGGLPCYRQVASLLDEAYRVSGKPRTISEDTLKKLEKNNKWMAMLIFHPELFASTPVK
jgi:hypothetical protein